MDNEAHIKNAYCLALAEKFANIDLKLGGVHNTAVTLPIR